MRVSRHNGRSGSHGTYNPKHNDRQFDVGKADGVKEDLTPFNIYWNCIDDRIVRHDELGENDLSFLEAEKRFYETAYHDYYIAQNERHIASRHKERCWTMDDLRENPKTCPEETIYQIGNIDCHVDPEVLASIADEFFREHKRRYGEHVHILNWALHLDESTPHIHERHVFDVINDKGERCPKQEQACEEMGFDLPDPSKKKGRFNNRKMSYDKECRQLLLDICKAHGLQIDEEPVYGGKQYLEKQEYIVEKLNTKATDMKEMIDDTQKLVDQMADTAYEKACEALIDKVADETVNEHESIIKRLSDWVKSNDCSYPAPCKKGALNVLKLLQGSFDDLKLQIRSKVRKALNLPDVKKACTKEIAEKVKPSIHGLLKAAKARVATEDQKRRTDKTITERKIKTNER